MHIVDAWLPKCGSQNPFKSNGIHYQQVGSNWTGAMLKDPTSLAASKLHPTAVPSDWVCLQHVKVPDYCSLHNSIQVWGLNNGNRNAVSWVQIVQLHMVSTTFISQKWLGQSAVNMFNSKVNMLSMKLFLDTWVASFPGHLMFCFPHMWPFNHPEKWQKAWYNS